MMQFSQKTVFGLFDGSQTYEIPVYQRAYSWGEDNWETFLQDLLEQIEGEHNYFFGNILLEVVKKSKHYEIIDGQQRVTTLSIFFRALFNILSERTIDTTEFDLKEKESTFIKSNGKIKLRPVEYDRACYDAIIVDNLSNFVTTTPSQDRIKKAKDYFLKELNKFTTDTLLAILLKLEDTELTTIELEGKKDSALMFELENNRGKDLTSMEKIKSYFMYQMYVYSPAEEVESNIGMISDIFKSIYLIINDLTTLNEDSLLIYHNNAYLSKGYSYRTIEDLKDVFKQSDDKVSWIKDYVRNLLESFSNIKQFEQSKNKYADFLRQLGIPAFIYPFIIKGYKYLKPESAELYQLFHFLEILVFRTKLINSRANIQERLNKILGGFVGDINVLVMETKSKLNETWYWGDDNTSNYLHGSLYGNNVLNYLLWRYEGSLQGRGYDIAISKIENEQIEHISPQTPPEGEALESGYDVNEYNSYSEEFIAQRLNCLGNLMLISGSHNASIGNRPFREKLESYKKNPLLNQQSEIVSFAHIVDDAVLWTENSIIQRQKKLVDFAINNWSFDKI